MEAWVAKYLREYFLRRKSAMILSERRGREGGEW